MNFGILLDRAVYAALAVFGALSLLTPHLGWLVMTGWHYAPEDRKGRPGPWPRFFYRLAGGAILAIALVVLQRM